jgi:hypothetical protein
MNINGIALAAYPDIVEAAVSDGRPDSVAHPTHCGSE